MSCVLPAHAPQLTAASFGFLVESIAGAGRDYTDFFKGCKRTSTGISALIPYKAAAGRLG